MCFLSCRPLSTAEGDPCSLYRRSDSPRSPLLSERTGKKNIWCHQTVKSCLNEFNSDGASEHSQHSFGGFFQFSVWAHLYDSLVQLVDWDYEIYFPDDESEHTEMSAEIWKPLFVIDSNIGVG